MSASANETLALFRVVGPHYDLHMNDLWTRLEALAKKNKKTLGLRKGVSEKAITSAEKAMKLRIPDDFRASLLLHDGQEGDQEELFEWMPGCSPLASLSAIVEQWKEEQDNVDEDDDEEPEVGEGGLILEVLFHPKRIPIAGTPYWDGDTSHLDLVPGPKGTAGQLITLVSEVDMVVLGASFRAALESHVSGLESGAWKGGNGDDHRSNIFANYVQKHGKKAASRKA